MPYAVAKDDRCPVARPWGVTNSDTNRLHGCHTTRNEAIQQQRALYAAEQSSRSGRMEKFGPPAQVKITDESKGEVEAVFSTLNVVDKDRDVTLPGAFGEQNVRISAFNHQSWNGELPIGKGTIRETGTEAIMKGRFFLDTTKGRDTFVTIKELGELMEWSYGYDILERSEGKWPEGDEKGDDVQFLKKLKVHEVSPVILGAGVDTRTLSAKNANKGAIPYSHTGTTDVNWDGSMMTRRCAASQNSLRALMAWFDSTGNPDSKSTYKFPHHMVAENGAVGAANTRACAAVIAVLNGGRGGTSIPEGDRKAVYAHVSHHMQDAGAEPAPLKSREQLELETTTGLKLYDQLAVVCFDFEYAVTRVAEAVAMRAEKGEQISDQTKDMVSWLLSNSERLREAVANEPRKDQTPELEHQYVESIFRDSKALLALTRGVEVQ